MCCSYQVRSIGFFRVDNSGAEHKWMQKGSIEESEICEHVWEGNSAEESR
jgi:hypothetical protein